MNQEIPQADLEVIFPTTFQPSNLESDLEYRINDDDADPVLSEKRCFRHLTNTHELLKAPNAMLEVEELEKDALLEESPFSEPYCTIKAKEKSPFDFGTWEVRKKLNFEGSLTPPNFDDNQKSTECGSKKQAAALDCNREELRASKDFYSCSSKRSCPKDSEVGTQFFFIF